MSNIKKVYYSKVPSNVLSVGQMLDYYFLSNTRLDTTAVWDEFFHHEERSIHTRNQLIADAIQDGSCPKDIDLNSSIMGISVAQDSVIVMADINP